ncbi:MAG: hypothetical protein WDN46_07195 [Methylocella sp.]
MSDASALRDRCWRRQLDAAIEFCRSHAPHLLPIYAGVRDEKISFVTVLQNAGAFAPKFDWPTVVLFGDDRDAALGLTAFHRKSVEAVLDKIGAAAVISSAPAVALYAAAAAGAAMLRQHVLIVETRERFEVDWTNLIGKRRPSLPLLVSRVGTERYPAMTGEPIASRALFQVVESAEMPQGLEVRLGSD